ncbi:glycosyltransferase family 1 protein [Nostoc sp. FACHB-110]|uniref:glycosyltransferase family 1 protein n=1 Tax=Nostoc sp. FACHB-110 TaxID=2692834 RepID=UPI00168581E7|nr:glycosyltransferase family 1 protein [Nostoc sp. FACHB-110]MBD2436132.1 glycosyltransferase family 1 protein [Nostoc sp. FACHB-110]
MNTDDMQTPPILVSVIPNLMGGEGHIIPYHNAVNKAAKCLDWQHIVVFSPDAKFTDIPPTWLPSLSPEDLEATLHPIVRIFKFTDILKLSFSISNTLKKDIFPKSKTSILFLERFIHVQLLALLIALCITPRKNVSVWLLYRRDTHKDKTRWIYKLLNKSIKKILAPGKFHLLTDSEILSKSISNYFHEPVAVMPIPHTEFMGIGATHHSTQEIICWWPGTPRPEKGWDVVKSLINDISENARQICIVAAQSSELIPTINSAKVKLVSNYLTELEYLNWLKESDIILLPYDAVAYQERTSGIFTECIMAGKIPLVTAGTWMATELAKYDLTELIIEDWSQSTIIVNLIINSAKSLSLKAKIKFMQTSYHNFHCVESYAKHMYRLFENSYN